MSGHSKWATIKRAKGSADAKRGVLFTKLSKNISLAAKQGKDPEMNSSLRSAIDAAKSANMPKANIERAVLRGAGELPGQQIEEHTYEGYGPGGLAIIIRCATDNTNRTGTFIKTTFNKGGGKLAKPGAVGYMFKQRGILRTEDASDETQLLAMDSGAEDIVEEDGGLTIYTEPKTLDAVKEALGDTVVYASVDLVPETRTTVDDKTKASAISLLETLENNEDVVEVTHNGKF